MTTIGTGRGEFSNHNPAIHSIDLVNCVRIVV